MSIDIRMSGFRISSFCTTEVAMHSNLNALYITVSVLIFPAFLDEYCKKGNDSELWDNAWEVESASACC